MTDRPTNATPSEPDHPKPLVQALIITEAGLSEGGIDFIFNPEVPLPL